MTYSGRCACGAVCYTIGSAPIRGFQCQCSDCQRDTGSGHSSIFVFARSAVSVTGEVREIERTAARRSQAQGILSELRLADL